MSEKKDVTSKPNKTFKILNMIKVEDVMTKDLVYASLDDPVYVVVKKLVENHITGVPIIDEDDRVIGVSSETDILKLYCEDFSKYTAKDIMSDRLETINSRDSLRDAFEKMNRERVHRLLVLSKVDAQHQEIQGIISIYDILKILDFLIDKGEDEGIYT